MEITLSEARKLINVSRLAEITEISYQRLDKNFKGDSNSLTAEEKQKIHAAIRNNADDLLTALNKPANELV